MMAYTVRVAVLYGFGINCDHETKAVFEMAGAEAERIHVNQLVNGDKTLTDYHIMAVPGGFSFGDHLGSGRLLGNRLRFGIRDMVQEFVKSGKLVIGICNGFHGFIAVLLPPMVLSFTDATGLGFIESVLGMAFLVGSIISLRISDRIQGDMKVAIIMGLLCGLAIIVGSLRPSIYLLCIFGIIEGVSWTIQYTVSSGAWLAITDQNIRGISFALRGTIAQILRPFGLLIAGPLGDYLEFTFYPKNVDLFAPLVGTGPGRGFALLFFVVGVLYTILWVFNFKNKNLEGLSRQVREAIKEQ